MPIMETIGALCTTIVGKVLLALLVYIIGKFVIWKILNLARKIKGIEALDGLVPQIVDAVLAKGGQILLTADHGNADEMLDENGNVMTAHSLNDVPLINISADPAPLKDGGKLCDIAPTMLKLMGLAIPEEMTGQPLV